MGPIKVFIKSEFADVLDGNLVKKIYDSLQDYHYCSIKLPPDISFDSCELVIDSEDEEIRDEIFKTKVERKINSLCLDSQNKNLEQLKKFIPDIKILLNHINTLYVTSTTEDFPLSTEDVEGVSDGLVESSSISASSSKNENQTSDSLNSNIENISSEHEIKHVNSSNSEDEVMPEDKTQDKAISKPNDFDKDGEEIKPEDKMETEAKLGTLVDLDSLTPNVTENENENEIEIEASAEAKAEAEVKTEIEIEIERDGNTIVELSNDTDSTTGVNVDVEMVDLSVKDEFIPKLSNKAQDSLVENNDLGICGDHPFDAADTGIVHVNASSLSASESKESYVKAHKLQNIPFKLDEPELESEIGPEL
ncbi:hypothetical protein AYI70_g6159 [Smittium culicis]|uniref:Uncharacterized protein n=1 Tax=Smittium culicis TaxID=133412 RepID=A0A1R1XRD0_9FUNG|nr:hypothetical protein AYI70_g6159 [Smittium culicis]